MEASRNYDDFIAQKHIRVKDVGIEVDRSELNPGLFEWQKDIVLWGLRKGRDALFEGCGLGKTIQQLDWARIIHENTNGDILILAPLAVAKQTQREGKKFNIPVSVCRAQADVKPGINVTNYEMLEHFDPSKFIGVVLDECFPFDIPVDVFNIDFSLESRYIKDIKAGDKIFNAQGVDHVKAVCKRSINRAVQISIDGKRFTCSENHPFFTVHGWQPAQDLRAGDYLMATGAAMRMVRYGILPQELECNHAEVLRTILLSEMEDEHPRTQGQGSYSRSGQEKGLGQIEMVQIKQSKGNQRTGANRQSESNEQPKDYSQNGRDENKEWNLETMERGERRKWEAVDHSSTNSHREPGGELDCRTSNLSGEKKAEVSNLLQSGLGESTPQDSNRSGWPWPYQCKEEASRSKKGFDACFFRVESVEILEPGHPELEKYRDADGFIYFYDLEIEQHPSFSINGVLVHNSSILKSMTGKTRTSLIQLFSQTPYRLCCTATPAPNDHMEIGNHSEFLGAMPNVQMLAKFFVNDASKTGTWRLKGHGVKPFWEWVSSWAVFVTKPSDIGYQDEGFALPPLNINKVVVSAPTDYKQGFFGGSLGAMDMHRRGRVTAPYRAKAVADLVNSNKEQWMVWCNSNYEADELRSVLPGVIEVRGSDSNDRKEAAIMDFIDGETRVLISKPSIFGFGLNLQMCHNVVFAGMSYSFEQAYQAIRRFWRFGQESPVNVHYVMDMTEIGIFDSVMEKERKHKEMEDNMVNFIDSEKELRATGPTLIKAPVNMGNLTGDGWEIRQGDSMRLIKDISDNSIHFSIFSPPFSNIFVYSDDPADMGNCLDDDEFFEHFRFLVPELLRATVPGRLCAVHCSVLPIFKWKEDVIGLKDFRGQVIRLFQECGWIFHSEVCIWKDPVVEMQRTKSLGLLYKQLKKDSSQCRQGLPDYLLVFRKWPDSVSNIQPVEHTPETFDLPLWQRYASPVWFDINQGKVLNYRLARSEKDERHICPLQLDVIERALRLWTSPGEIVLSPFAGIGSEGYEAVKSGRRFLGLELKLEYVKVAADNLRAAERMSKRSDQGFNL